MEWAGSQGRRPATAKRRNRSRTLRRARHNDQLPEGERKDWQALWVEVGELLGVFDRILRDADERTLYHYVLVDFLCRRIAGELQAAGDAADARWFTCGELGSLSLAEDTAAVIKLGFEKSGSVI